MKNSEIEKNQAENRKCLAKSENHYILYKLKNLNFSDKLKHLEAL